MDKAERELCHRQRNADNFLVAMAVLYQFAIAAVILTISSATFTPTVGILTTPTDGSPCETVAKSEP